MTESLIISKKHKTIAYSLTDDRTLHLESQPDKVHASSPDVVHSSRGGGKNKNKSNGDAHDGKLVSIKQVLEREDSEEVWVVINGQVYK